MTERAAVHQQVLGDLADESADLLGLLERLEPGSWTTPTPAEGWSVHDQVTHLAHFDDAARLALQDPDAFRAERDALLEVGAAFPDVLAERYRGMSAVAALDWLRTARAALLEVLGSTAPGTRMPWYGPDMGVTSCVTARLMETWAHGQDVADAVGVERVPTDRLRSVADLGVRTRAFAFALHGRPVPEEPVHVALTGPGGDVWTWGPEEAPDRVTGPALDFCLLVVQRRHLRELDLVVVGPVATAWTEVAQAYAGAPGRGRA
ncbi:MAG: wyosine base formation [Frankiales bacterium]|nr:wyosine base formation [Frankiales bacterium]